MRQKFALLSLLLFLATTVSFGTVDPKNGSNNELVNAPDQQELIVADQDSLAQQRVVEEPKKKEQPEEEEESVSILSVNIIFEIISHFNLRDLLNLPTK